MDNEPKKIIIYISLQEATKYCSYSQEYLSLRARQGKLKAVKIGRNWVTKKEWVKEYLAKAEEYKNNLHDLKTKKLPEAVGLEKGIPPLNLPIDKLEAAKLSRPLCLHKLLYEEEKLKAKIKIPIVRFGFLFALTFVLLIAGGIVFKESFYPLRDSIVNLSNNISIDISCGLNRVFSQADSYLKTSTQRVNQGVNKKTEAIVLGLEKTGINLIKIVPKKILSGTETFGQVGVLIIEETILKVKNSFQDVSFFTYIIVEPGAKTLFRAISNSIKGFTTISETVDNTISIAAEKTLSLSQFLVAISSQDVFEYTSRTFKEYSQWILKQTFSLSYEIKKVSQRIRQGYIIVYDFIGQKLEGFNKNIKNFTLTIKIFSNRQASKIKNLFRDSYIVLRDGYLAVFDFIEEEINQGYKVLSQKIKQGYKALSRLWRKPEKIVEEEIIPKPTKEGMIVIPSTEKDEEVKKKIKEAFSDEVKVEPKDETSGIIIPVFREIEGGKYLYILVPVKNEN